MLLNISLIAFIIFLWNFRKKSRTMFDEIKSQLIASGLTVTDANRLAGYMLAQAKHETANFTSKSYTVAHNLFGMKESSRSNSTGSYLGHAKFSTDEFSILDMIQYLKSSRVYKLSDYAKMDMYKYILTLKSRGYFEDSFLNYYNGVAKFYVK